jgi:hypothetical protein
MLMFSKDMYHQLESEGKALPFDTKGFMQWAEAKQV